MAPSFMPLLLSIFAVGALSKNPHLSCNSPCYAGFKDIPGIASLCNNANRPTTTIEQSVTAYTTIVSTVTISNYRYTDYHYTTPVPTKLAGCGTPQALAAAAAPVTMSSGSLILSKVAGARPTAPALMPRDESKSQCCPPVKDGITGACSCFFTPGPQQTVTRNHTVATGTVYSTTATTTFIYSVRTRTIAEGCYATNVPVYGSATYAVCGSGGIPVDSYRECPLPKPSGAPFSFDAEDCCSACANTLDCFQAYTDPATNTCNLDIRLVPDATNRNKTTDCPNYHTWVNFGDLQGYEYSGTYYSGFIAGHCHQSC